MQPNQTIINAALAGMTHVLNFVPDDRVLVITDEATSSCGHAFEQAAVQFGCECVLYQLPEENRPLQKMPVLSVTGGIPKYLEEIDISETAENNIKTMCFDRSGILFNE